MDDWQPRSRPSTPKLTMIVAVPRGSDDDFPSLCSPSLVSQPVRTSEPDASKPDAAQQLDKPPKPAAAQDGLLKPPHTKSRSLDDVKHSSEPKLKLATGTNAVAAPKIEPSVDLQSLRQESLGRLHHAWHHICEKYGRVFESDEIDLSTGNIVVNRGFIQTMTESEFGRSLRKSLEAATGTGRKNSKRSRSHGNDKDGKESGLEPVKLIAGMLYDDDAFEQILGSESPEPKTEPDALQQHLDQRQSPLSSSKSKRASSRADAFIPDPRTIDDLLLASDDASKDDPYSSSDADSETNMELIRTGSPRRSANHDLRRQIAHERRSPTRMSASSTPSHALIRSAATPTHTSSSATRWHDQGVCWTDGNRKMRRFHPYPMHGESNRRWSASVRSRLSLPYHDAVDDEPYENVHDDRYDEHDNVYYSDDVYEYGDDEHVDGDVQDRIVYARADGGPVVVGPVPYMLMPGGVLPTPLVHLQHAFVDHGMPQMVHATHRSLWRPRLVSDAHPDDAYASDDFEDDFEDDDLHEDDYEDDDQWRSRLQWHARMQTQMRDRARSIHVDSNTNE